MTTHDSKQGREPQMTVAREIMKRRKAAMQALAGQIMDEDREILRKLAK